MSFIILLSFIFILICIYFFYYVFSDELKIGLLIFSIFYLLYLYYPYFYLIFFNEKNLYLSDEILVSIQPNIEITLLYISSFFFLFCSGLTFIEFFYNKCKMHKFFNVKLIDYSYNFAVVLILFSLILSFIFFYPDYFLFNYSYQKNQSSNFGFFSMLKSLIIFFLCVFFFLEKRSYLLFSALITLLLFLTFYTRDKDWLIYIFVICLVKVYLNKKYLFNPTNLIFFFITLIFFLTFFFPFFSVYRGTNDLLFALKAVVKDNFIPLGDPSSPLAILHLLIDDEVRLEYFNILYNFTSFLPANLRINYDYGIMFAKKIVGDQIAPGQGFAFSVLSELIIYKKEFGIYFYCFIVFLLGIFYSLIIKFIKIIIPKKIEIFMIFFFSSFMSFAIVRSSLAGYLQFTIRYIICLYILFILFKIIKKFNKRFHGKNSIY